MPLEVSLPALALAAAAITALIYRLLPEIAIRTHSEKHSGIGIREVAVSFSRPDTWARPAGAVPRLARFEFVIYMTLKSCNN